MKSPALCSEECGYSVFTCMCGCVRAAVHARATYGPQSTRRERTLSIPMSHTFIHSPVISIQRPWKFSWSYTHIWIEDWDWGKENENGRKEVTEAVSKSRATPKESRDRLERLWWRRKVTTQESGRVKLSGCAVMTAFSTVTHRRLTWYFSVSCSYRPPPQWAISTSRSWEYTSAQKVNCQCEASCFRQCEKDCMMYL